MDLLRADVGRIGLILIASFLKGRVGLLSNSKQVGECAAVQITTTATHGGKEKRFVLQTNKPKRKHPDTQD